MDETKSLRAALQLKQGGAEGEVSAVFSTFNVVDKGGDVVLASAFTHGQEVAMTWHHRWDMPVGKGRVLVESERAIFEGRFFLDTTAGQEAYKTVKNMDNLQQWSWGFRVTDAAFEQRDGEYIRVIKRAEVYEVAPVLIGEGEGTHTLAVKGHLTYTDEAEAVLAAAKGFAERSRSLADLRATEGRCLSTANCKRLESVLSELRAVSQGIESLLAREPEDGAKAAVGAFLDYQRICARLGGAH